MSDMDNPHMNIEVIDSRAGLSGRIPAAVLSFVSIQILHSPGVGGTLHF